MATFLDELHMFSSYFVSYFCSEGRNIVLIVPVPGHWLPFTVRQYGSAEYCSFI